MKKGQLVKAIAEAVLDYLKKLKKEELLPDVINYLERKDADDVAWVFSPRKLSATEKNMLKGSFKKLTGTIPLKVKFATDKTLIDGLKISYKDRLWDFSLLKQIESLKEV